MAGDDVGVAVAAGLDGAPLAGVVDVNKAEALRVAVGPFEIVEQRPGEVAGDRGARTDGLGTGVEVLLQVGDAVEVIDGAISGDVVRRQLIEPTLGADGKPVFKSSIGCPFKKGTPTDCDNWSVSKPVITSADSFNQWYRDTPGVNIAFEKTLELVDSGGGLYKYNSTSFFPLGNDQGFGITPPGQSHNFLFTTEVHVTFEYVKGQTFSFQGDDDMWIFVNGRLALDLGSMHSSEPGEIKFDDQAANLGIVVGRAYPMDIFHAERHTSASNFGVETNIACFTPAIVR